MSMIKQFYKEELEFTGPYARGENSEGKAEAIQEWLNLNKNYIKGWDPNLLMDDDFGVGTEKALIAWQQKVCVGADPGVVDEDTWNKLVQPLLDAFTVTHESFTSVRDLILYYCEQHLAGIAQEVGSNEGPWVRSYMGGNDGKQWAWCMGFAQTMLDQAYSTVGRKFTDIMPLTYSCDIVGEHGLKTKALICNADLRKLDGISEKVKPGDLFLIVKTEHDWVHTGIIEKVKGDILHTIEGNTNDEGSREGYELCRRKRNFRKSNIDVFVIS
ncbi:MAG: peptidoglycan-binding protein [Planctomycetota bacterium]|nr:MAG: peptidoglycan-binding protein [Planctomycetota bacterium]